VSSILFNCFHHLILLAIDSHSQFDIPSKMPLHETTEIFDDSVQQELLYEIRVDMALDAWKQAQGALSLRKAASKHGIAYTTLQNRSKGAIPRKDADQAKQRLSVQEEAAVHKWILQLRAWG
jgi:hypothetical protein